MKSCIRFLYKLIKTICYNPCFDSLTVNETSNVLVNDDNDCQNKTRPRLFSRDVNVLAFGEYP